MWPDPQETADLVTFTEEIFEIKLHFLCSIISCFLLKFRNITIKGFTGAIGKAKVRGVVDLMGINSFNNARSGFILPVCMFSPVF